MLEAYSREAKAEREAPFRYEDLDVIEVGFYRELDMLRKSSPDAGVLADKWEKNYEDVIDANGDLDEFFQRFINFLSRRKDALSSLELGANVVPEIADKIRSFDRSVMRAFGNPDLFLGNGATAEVYRLPEFKDICVKYITNQAQYNESNHMRDEYKYLTVLSELAVGKARLPSPSFLRIHPNEGHSFGMELVDGKSLSRLLENPEDARELVAIAQRVDRDAVMRDLTGLIELIHQRGITHNDLHLRNIMVDREGHFFIIDFGKAKTELVGQDHEMFRASDLATLKGELKGFFQDIDKIKL